MAPQQNEIKAIINDRQLSQWHLMIASLLGSLASQHGMFNQAFLNRILKHSMENFILPYFETLPEFQEAIKKIPSGSSLQERLKPAVEFIDSVFELAGQIEIIEQGQDHAVLKVGSSGCRFCPIGVGKADMAAGMTFCPFPTMIEETAVHMLGGDRVKTVLHREGTKTKILIKEDGSCHIEYEIKQDV